MENHKFYLIRRGNKIGFINEKGEEVIPPQFQNSREYRDVEDFSDWFPIKQKGKWGYINAKGEWMIKPKFDAARRFSEDLAVIALSSLENEKYNPFDYTRLIYGYIDRKGEIVIPAKYLGATEFTYGKAWVLEAENYKEGKIEQTHIINKKGEVLKNVQYYAFYKENDKRLILENKGLVPRDKRGYLTRDPLQAVVDMDYNVVFGFNYEKLCIYQDLLWVLHQDRVKLVNYKNEVIFEQDLPKEEYAAYAAVHGGPTWTSMTFRFKFTNLLHPNEGLAAAYLNDRFVFIDMTGKIVFESEDFEEIGLFHEGLCRVKLKNKWGYIDKTGKMVIPPKFEGAFNFSHSLALATAKIKEKGKVVSRTGFIDKKGEFAIQPRFYKDPHGFGFEGNKLAKLRLDAKRICYINLKGEVVWKES